MGDTPSGLNSGAIPQIWGKRPCDPAPFALALSVRDSEVSLSQSGYAPLSDAVLYVQNVQRKKDARWMKSSRWYRHAGRILLSSYILFISLGEEGGAWLHMDTANMRYAALACHERLRRTGEVNLWEDILGAETIRRLICHEKQAADEPLSIGDIVTLSPEAAPYPDESSYAPTGRRPYRSPYGEGEELLLPQSRFA